MLLFNDTKIIFNIKINKIILTSIFIFLPFIDVLNGYLIHNNILTAGGVGSPSQMIRFIILFLIMYSLRKSNKILIVLVLIVYFMVIEGVSTFLHGNEYGYLSGIIYSFKIIYIILIYQILTYVYDNGLASLEEIKNVFILNIIISSVLLLIPFLLGIGVPTYDGGGFGSKGFYPGGNALGLYLGIGLLFMVHNRKVDNNFFYLILVFCATLIVATKTTLILCFLALLYIFFTIYSKLYQTIIILILGLFLFFYSEIISDTFSSIFDVVLYRFQNPDYLAFLLSSRDVFFYSAMDIYSLDGFYLWRLFFGFGAYISYRNPNQIDYPFVDILESDLMDLFFMYGLIVLLGYVFMILYILYLSIIYRVYFLAFIFLLLSLHSFFAGHVVFNGMTGTLIPLIIFFITRSKSEKNSFYTSTKRP